MIGAKNIVIVGAGQACSQAIFTLRQRGFTGAITLVGDEPHFPYHRPPLSKKYLAGELSTELMQIRPAQFYAEQRVDARLGRRAYSIDRSARRVLLDDGSSVSYDALLLALGSAPRPTQIAGADLAGVFTLRTIADADGIRAQLLPGRRIVIVGAGYIGLEIAAICRQLQLDVTVLELADRVMSRVVCDGISRFYHAEHSRRGVRIVCGARVTAFAPDAREERVRAVVTDDRREYPADLVLVGIGAVPTDALAREAGLECSDGVLVDERCRSSDPLIFAAGDCTNQPSLRYGRRVRLESVNNAFEQGATAALNMLGVAAIHDSLPWFWSDQYELKLIIVGLSEGYDAVVTRGDVDARSFSAWYLRAGEILAVDTINTPKELSAARKLVAARARPDSAKLANPGVALSECV